MKRISSLLSALLALCVLLSSMPAAVSEAAEPAMLEAEFEVEAEDAEAGVEEAEEFELGGEEEDAEAGEMPIEEYVPAEEELQIDDTLIGDAEAEPADDAEAEPDAPMDLLMEEPEAEEEEAEAEAEEEEIPTFLLEKNASVKMNLNDQLQVVTAENVEIKSCVSGNARVVSVDKTGLLTAKGEGIVRVTFTVTGNKWLVLTVTVVDPTKPTGVSFEEGKAITIDIAAGEPVQLNAVMTPETAVSDLKWRATYTAFAKVDANGLVTPVAEGKTTITVTTARASKTATITVTVVDSKKPTSVKFEQGSSVTIPWGQDYALTPIMTPDTAESDFTFKSSNTKVAMVDENGVVTPVAEGITYITVTTVRGKKTAMLTLKVVDPYKPTSVKFEEGKSGTVNLGTEYTLTALLTPETAITDLKWKSTNTRVATVDENGVVTPVAEGTAYITVTTVKGSKTAMFTLKVVDPTKPTGVTLAEGKSGTVNWGDTLQLNAVLAPETAVTDLKWKSSNAKVATVDENGLVTPVAEGTAYITVTTVKGSKSFMYTLKVVDPYKPTGVKFEQGKSGTAYWGTDYPLTAVLAPETAITDLKWKSTNTRVAKVDENGVVTPVSEGTAYITVTTVKGSKTAMFTLKVVDPYKPTGVTLAEGKSGTVNWGDTFQLNAVLSPETAVSDLKWKSSNAKVATVDENGLVTPVSEGTAYITVTTVKGSKSFMYTLKVVDPYKPTSVKFEEGKAITLNLGAEYALNPVMTPETAISDLSFRSSNARVAKVDATGLVTPLTEGTAIITVTTAKGSKTATITVTVVDPYKPTAIELLDGAAIELSLNEIYPLDYRLVPDTAESGVTWKTSNAKVATVNAFGEVTAHAEGTATITATTAKSGRTDGIKVTVIDPTKPSRIELYDREENLLKGTVNLPVACDNMIEVRVLPEEALDSHSYTISCSNTAIVGLEAQDEYFWGKKKGTATITVKADTGLAASFTVNVVANKIDNLCAKPTAADVTALKGAWDAWLKSVEIVSEDQVVCEYYFLNGRADTVTKLEDLAAWVNVNGTDVADGEITSITVNAAAKSWKTIKVTLTGNDVIDTNIDLARQAASGVDYGFAYE